MSRIKVVATDHRCLLLRGINIGRGRALRASASRKLTGTSISLTTFSDEAGCKGGIGERNIDPSALIVSLASPCRMSPAVRGVFLEAGRAADQPSEKTKTSRTKTGKKEVGKAKESKFTTLRKYRNYNEATAAIRAALGIKFGDFYNLAPLNAFVEGPSDRETFSSVLRILPKSEYPWEFVRAAKFEDFGGVKHLGGFLRATYQFIQKEYASVSLFDGDEAGSKERQNLQQYFGQIGVGFEANQHFISIRSGFAIEGLFPDDWIKLIHAENPKYFSSFSVDAADTVEAFRIHDDRKDVVQKMLLSFADMTADPVWAAHFIAVFDALDSALKKQALKLYGAAFVPI